MFQHFFKIPVRKINLFVLYAHIESQKNQKPILNIKLFRLHLTQEVAV